MWIALAVPAHPRIKAYRRSRRNADERADDLLRSWLTWEQRRQWRSSREFEVTGCDTGTRYRITQSAVMNVQQLDESGRCIARWCFMPKGELARGDVLLAQKNRIGDDGAQGARGGEFIELRNLFFASGRGHPAAERPTVPWITPRPIREQRRII
jgi:hypothetical protein